MAASCGQTVNDKGPVELNGPPDGIGLALAGNELEWTVAPRITLVSGDEVTVTVLDDSAPASDGSQNARFTATRSNAQVSQRGLRSWGEAGMITR